MRIFRGNGDGTFTDTGTRLTGLDIPFENVAADLDDDRDLDLAVLDIGTRKVAVFRNDGPAGFQDMGRFAVGPLASGLLAQDFDGDDSLDLAVGNGFAGSLTVLRGNGNGTFAEQVRYALGVTPGSLVSADFDGNGRPDLAVRTRNAGPEREQGVLVVLGREDGTFRDTATGFAVPQPPDTLTSGDFDRDGRSDLATANRLEHSVSFLQGLGDGTLQVGEASFPVGSFPEAIVSADFNDDGRLDVATANATGNSVSVLLGLGNGEFADAGPPLPVGESPQDLLTADFDLKNGPDLAVLSFDGTLHVLLGRGDGTFEQKGPFAVGEFRRSLASGLFDTGSIPDLAVVGDSGEVSILFGRGDGTFDRGDSLIGTGSLITRGDYDGDGKDDLAVLNSGPSDTVQVLLGDGQGHFTAAPGVGTFGGDDFSIVFSMASADLDNDGLPDVIVADASSNNLVILRSVGNGNFAPQVRIPLGGELKRVLADDLNDDGLVDLAVTKEDNGEVQVLVNLGDLRFQPSTSLFSSRTPNTPLIVDVTGDGVRDAVLVNEGDLLVRRGGADTPGEFDAPREVNDVPAQAVAAVAKPRARRRETFRLAAIDASARSVSVYDVSRDGTRTAVTRIELPPDVLVTRIASADLNGDGFGDLVLSDVVGNRLLVLEGRASGQFVRSGPAEGLAVGNGPEDVVLADVDGANGTDILVANRVSGDVSVFTNDGRGNFGSGLRFRADVGLHGMVADLAGSLGVRSGAGTAALAVGDFDKDGIPDVVAVNPGARGFSLLRGKVAGNLVDPEHFYTGFAARAVRAGQFNDDNGDSKVNRRDCLDLAILNEGDAGIQIYLGDGRGGFTLKSTAPAGNDPSGFSLADLDGDGIVGLVVGNELGDLLFLPGNGDGTFQEFTRSERGVPFVRIDLNGDGVRDDVVTANQARDHVQARVRREGTRQFEEALRFAQGRDDGIQGPGDLHLDDLDGDGQADMLIANSGSTTMRVYRGLGNGQFDSNVVEFFTGSNPSALFIADLNGDNTPDLVVANRGSNDVSVLFGRGQRETWTLEPGPRLDVGRGPMAIELRDVDVQALTGNAAAPGLDGIPDLLVTNGQDGTISVLPGRGQAGIGTGFFNDSDQAGTINIPGNPTVRQQVPGFILTDGGDIFGFNGTVTQEPLFTSSAGREVRAITPFGTDLFAAFSDGGISRLDDAVDGLAEEFLFDTDLLDPSRLEILDTGEGLELYATDAGLDDVEIFPLDVAGEGIPTVVATPEPLRDSPVTVVATFLVSLSEGSLGIADLDSVTDIDTLLITTGDDSEGLIGEDLLAQLAGKGKGGPSWEDLVAAAREMADIGWTTTVEIAAETWTLLSVCAGEVWESTTGVLQVALKASGWTLEVPDLGLRQIAVDVGQALWKATAAAWSEVAARFEGPLPNVPAAPAGDAEEQKDPEWQGPAPLTVPGEDTFSWHGNDLFLAGLAAAVCWSPWYQFCGNVPVIGNERRRFASLIPTRRPA